MKAKAKLNNLRISPRKVRYVADLIRGMGVNEAKTQLQFLVKKSTAPLLKLLNSALANAKQNEEIDIKKLHVSEITVNQGATLKRGRARARGSMYTIRKRTSHVSLTISDKN